MVDDDKKRFAEVLTATSELYGKSFSIPAMRIWFAALMQHDIGAVADAFSRHVASPDGKFMPVPADIIRLIEGSTQDAALLAWTKFTDALERVGTYQTVVFDDPIIHTVADDMGGWVQFGSTPIDEMRFRGLEFQRRYQAYKQRAGDIRYPSKLIGISEADNRQRGYNDAVPEPLLIGDREKAQQVLLAGGIGPRLEISTLGSALKMLPDIESDEAA